MSAWTANIVRALVDWSTSTPSAEMARGRVEPHGNVGLNAHVRSPAIVVAPNSSVRLACGNVIIGPPTFDPSISRNVTLSSDDRDGPAVITRLTFALKPRPALQEERTTAG